VSGAILAGASFSRENYLGIFDKFMFNLNKRIIRQALDLSPVATLIVDLKTHPHPVVYVNQAFEALSGYDAGELIGHPWQELLCDVENAEQLNAEILPGQRALLNCHPRLGVSDTLSLDMLPLYDRPGTPRYWVGTETQQIAVEAEERDEEREALLSVLREARMHLRRLDGRDSATGLLSQRAFDDLLQRDWVMARREKRMLSLVVLRVDGFKAYREVFGRHAADSCLAKVAHAITGSLRRAGDLAARHSDDQFIVLVGNSEKQHVATLAENIAAKVRGLAIHHPRSPVDRFVTVSYGVASGTPSAELHAADLLVQATGQLEPEVTGDLGFSVI
jgi:diguanylate cyclase (GGDEF)-like protein